MKPETKKKLITAAKIIVCLPILIPAYAFYAVLAMIGLVGMMFIWADEFIKGKK
jgi:hypothetical protein